MSTLSSPLATSLASECRLSNPDGYFQLLTDACQDLDASAGHLLHAQLVLLLMNHIGDEAVLREAIVIARQGLKLLSTTAPYPQQAHSEGTRT
ncbi:MULTISPECIES: DUF2783 domain-containing protein [unclassified Pseudomonas]|jgi:hypothetical protein|uniref:DUF2783 domain-containing protein n=1 Tax=unclassified Pseudomonas TaxID=196821 RepID=UPI000BA2DF50|nr:MULTISPECIES: DUF2783 domain-containing protein [unclassified Pseudomonas]MCU1722632.1 DUF2783 domain-containing protein [Pseudomonas sp. 5P_5.1_Bac1]MCU1733759.1 DUF2783 domain-containing protein [Pseudomonas sp. 20P_3.2_Bac4]MCU1742559.1 DUF2783 domain-containing protein [Pseudomonas sp. 20P_3.2_Bac5]